MILENEVLFSSSAIGFYNIYQNPVPIDNRVKLLERQKEKGGSKREKGMEGEREKKILKQ